MDLKPSRINITARRCQRCGAIQHQPPPSGFCSNCETWKKKTGK